MFLCNWDSAAVSFWDPFVGFFFDAFGIIASKLPFEWDRAKEKRDFMQIALVIFIYFDLNPLPMKYICYTPLVYLTKVRLT